MRDLFFSVLLVATIPIGLISNYWAIAFWYWISYFQPHTQSFGFAREIPFGQVAAGVALVSWLLSREKKLPPATSIVILLVLMGVWISITTLTAMFPQPATGRWDVAIKLLLMSLLTVAVMQTRQRLNILIWTICIAVGYYGFKLGLFALAGGSGTSFRGPSYMNENNGLARAMIMFIPLLYYLYLQHKQLWVRMGLGAVALSSTAALVLSGSRGAWIAALAMSVFVGLRMKGGLLWMALAGIAGAAAIPLVPPHVADRFLSIGEMDTDISFQGRVGAWRYALELFRERPIVGGGFTVFEYGHGRASHNSFFQMLGEHGAIGLVLFVSLLTACALATRWIRRAAKERPDLAWASDLAFMLQVILVGYCIGSLTINHAVFPLLYGVISILASLQIIVRRQLQATSDDAGDAPRAANNVGLAPSPGARAAR